MFQSALLKIQGKNSRPPLLRAGGLILSIWHFSPTPLHKLDFSYLTGNILTTSWIRRFPDSVVTALNYNLFCQIPWLTIYTRLSVKYSPQGNVTACSMVGGSLLCQQRDKTQPQTAPGKVQVERQEEFLHRKGYQALEWTAQRDVHCQTPSLEVLRGQADIALSAMVQLTKQWLAKGWTLWSGGLFEPKRLCDYNNIKQEIKRFTYSCCYWDFCCCSLLFLITLLLK